MQFENVEEVAEEIAPAAVNKRLAEGWTLLAVTPGFNPHADQAYTLYVLGKVISNAEKTARLVKQEREASRGNEFLNTAG